jgi:gamma-glutamyltranspeptidase/glutathione hydrolase
MTVRFRLLITHLIICALAPSATLALPAEGQKVMIAGPSPYAITAGRAIARKGGNAADIAIAVAATLAVTSPYYGSLGGGGFALTNFGGNVKALDFRETAPAKTGPDTFAGKPASASIDGGLACGIPGVPAGLWELHKKHGHLPWKVLFEEAIRLADEGFEVSGEWTQNTLSTQARFNSAGKKIFFHADGRPYLPGDRLKQPGLAKLLRDLARRGPKAFYTGGAAKDLIAVVNKNGGAWTAEDLAQYQPRWLEPLSTEFAGHQIYLMPPPSSGGVVIKQALSLIEKLQITEALPLSVDELHGLAEVMKLSYRSRSRLGDPAFVQNPLDELFSDSSLKALAKLYNKSKSIPVSSLLETQTKEREETTHFSVMTANGDAVAFTVTLNGMHGSALVSERFGVTLNNEMDDFTTQLDRPNQYGLAQGAANQVRAGARPLSSMSPTIVKKDGQTVLVVGAPGGPKIISSVLQVTYRALTQSIDIDQAIQAPRVHHQFLPEKITVDPFRLPPESLELLRARGHKVDTGTTGRVFAIRRKADGLLSGAYDSRGEGAAGGF